MRCCSSHQPAMIGSIKNVPRPTSPPMSRSFPLLSAAAARTPRIFSGSPTPSSPSCSYPPSTSSSSVGKLYLSSAGSPRRHWYADGADNDIHCLHYSLVWGVTPRSLARSLRLVPGRLQFSSRLSDRFVPVRRDATLVGSGQNCSGNKPLINHTYEACHASAADVGSYYYCGALTTKPSEVKAQKLLAPKRVPVSGHL